MSKVALRPVIEADLPILFEHQADPISNQMAAFPPREKEAFMAHWSKIMVNKTITIKTILYHNQVAGNIISFETFVHREVGYWLGKEFWSKGIATQAVALFLPELKTRPLYAHVAKHNIGSRRVLEKNGFSICGEDIIQDEKLEKPVDGYILQLQ